MSDSDVRKDYVNAIIKVKVPKWQIGEKVSVYFPDTMATNGVCEEEPTLLLARGNSGIVIPITHTHIRCIRCGRVLKNPDAKERGYGEVCWKKHLEDKQGTLF